MAVFLNSSIQIVRKIQEIMSDLRWKAERNILAIQKVKSLNGLFGLRCYPFNTDILKDEIVQLWNARTVNNCSGRNATYSFQPFGCW